MGSFEFSRRSRSLSNSGASLLETGIRDPLAVADNVVDIAWSGERGEQCAPASST
jgi:hypothetical protein